MDTREALRSILCDEALDHLSPEERRQALWRDEVTSFDPLQYLYYAQSDEGREEVENLLRGQAKPWWCLPQPLPLSAHETALLKKRLLPSVPSRRPGSALLLPLIELLFGYMYNFLTTGGEDTIESAWTLIKLSPTLSGFAVAVFVDVAFKRKDH